MPNSLMDMFQPQDYSGKPIGFDQALRQNSNSLIGLGMGMLQPRSLAVGAPVGSAWTDALGGYQQGATQDLRRNVAQAQLAHQKQQEARQAAMDAFHRSQANITDAQRAMRDVLGPNAAPEQKADFMKQYYASKTDPGGWILKDIIDPNDPDGERKVTVQEHNRTGQIRPPQLPGQTGAVGPIGAANPFPAPGADGGGAPPVYGYGGNFSTPSAGAAAPGPPAQRHAITLPSGEVVTPPPGLNKEARKAWSADVAKTVADMQTGKMTEAQAKYSIYAKGMEIAQQELQNSSKLGASAEGKGLAALPWGMGAYFQSNEYQNYRNAKDAWLNAKLRAESGATINPDEFARDDRIYFPQPGEGPQQIAAKARLREQITQNMTRAGGPGYTKVPPLATAPAPPAPGGDGAIPGGIPPPPPGFILRQSNR